MKKANRVLSFILILPIVFIVSACAGNGESSNNNETNIVGYDETLICGFDSQEEILGKTLGMKEIREYKLSTDKKYVTQGNGALKFTYDSDNSDYYMPSAKDLSPAIYVLINEMGYGKDLSNLKAVVVDIYNTTAKNLSVSLYQRTKIGETKVMDLMSSPYIIKPGMNECVLDTELDRNVNFGMDNVSELCLVFPTVKQHESDVTIYVDNLRFRTLKSGDAPKDQNLPDPLTGGKITSFEDKSFYNKTRLDPFRKTQPLRAIWNGNPDYISDGERSFGVIAESAGELWRDEQPYGDLILPTEYVQALDFSAFKSETSTLKVDIYLKALEDVERFAIIIRFESGSATKMVKKEKGIILKANSWNTLDFAMYTEQGDQEQLVDWEHVTNIDFRIWQRKGGGTYIYYFDNIRVEG